MTPKLTKAKYLADYRISVCFEDGTEGVIDLENKLWEIDVCVDPQIATPTSHGGG